MLQDQEPAMVATPLSWLNTLTSGEIQQVNTGLRPIALLLTNPLKTLIKMKNSKINNFSCNKLNDYSKVTGGDGTQRVRLIDSGTTPCGDTYEVYGHFFLGIHYGTDYMVSDRASTN